MAKLLRGKEVAEVMNRESEARIETLREKDVQPRLMLIRCGENPSDLAYENSIVKAASIGVQIERVVLPGDISAEKLIAELEKVNADVSIHGCLLLRPLPAHLRAQQQEICNHLAASKDVDGMTDLSLAGVFTGKPLGFAPCTARACMEMLHHYGIACGGKNAVAIGRSLVVGKPVAMMLTEENATVTLCHSKTENKAEILRRADIVVSCAGVPGSLTGDLVRPGQVIVDVSMNWDAHKPNAKGGMGAMAGDAVFEEVEPIVEAITPVPGGVGTVTTAVLMRHVVEAAERSL